MAWLKGGIEPRAVGVAAKLLRGVVLAVALAASLLAPGLGGGAAAGQGMGGAAGEAAAESQRPGAGVLFGPGIRPGTEIRFTQTERVRVVYWPGDQGTAELTLDAAGAPLPLPGIPSAAVLPPSTIFLAPTPAVFDSLTSGGTPAWAAGVAIPSRRTIILPAYRTGGPFGDAVVTLRHELAHLALNGYIGSGVPRWFDEGYATWVSGGWDASSGWQIRFSLLAGNLPPLDSLRLGWPRSEARARLSYLLSASAVRHLAESRGERAFTAFLAEWRRDGSFDDALRGVYHLTPTQLEREWRGMVRTRYGWLLALSQVTIFWLGFAVLVIVLGTLRRRRNRERLEELRREEYMLPPATVPEVDPEIDPR